MPSTLPAWSGFLATLAFTFICGLSVGTWLGVWLERADRFVSDNQYDPERRE